MIAAPHVTVVGAGVVGMATALTLQRAGHAVTVIDRLEPGRATSFGNLGGFAVSMVQPQAMPGLLWKLPRWLLDPTGPLAIRPTYFLRRLPWFWQFWRAATPARIAALTTAQAALNQRCYDDYAPLLQAANLTDQVRRNGLLTLYRTEAGFRQDRGFWQLGRAHGVVADDLGPAEIRQLEPELGPNFSRAVFSRDWGQVLDPYRIVAGLAERFTGDGGEILQASVSGFGTEGRRVAEIRTDQGTRTLDRLVICAGVWSHILARQLGSAVPLESERGYHITLPATPIEPRRMLQFAEDGFVITRMSMGLRIGGTVEMGGLDSAPNMARARALLDKAAQIFPALATPAAREGMTEWSGHRPALPDTIAVISRSPHFANLLYGFGHGHLGLTQAATTGRLLTDLIAGTDSGIDLAPYRVDRFAKPGHPL